MLLFLFMPTSVTCDKRCLDQNPNLAPSNSLITETTNLIRWGKFTQLLQLFTVTFRRRN